MQVQYWLEVLLSNGVIVDSQVDLELTQMLLPKACPAPCSCCSSQCTPSRDNMLPLYLSVKRNGDAQALQQRTVATKSDRPLKGHRVVPLSKSHGCLSLHPPEHGMLACRGRQRM